MQTHANTGVDAYATPWRERIKGATKANSECVRFPLTLTRTHKRSPNLIMLLPWNTVMLISSDITQISYYHNTEPTSPCIGYVGEVNIDNLLMKQWSHEVS